MKQEDFMNEKEEKNKPTFDPIAAWLEKIPREKMEEEEWRPFELSLLKKKKHE